MYLLVILCEGACAGTRSDPILLCETSCICWAWVNVVDKAMYKCVFVCI